MKILIMYIMLFAVSALADCKPENDCMKLKEKYSGAAVQIYGNYEPGPDDIQMFLDIEKEQVGGRILPQIKGVYYSTERLEAMKPKSSLEITVRCADEKLIIVPQNKQ